jgi:hypothetical protein
MQGSDDRTPSLPNAFFPSFLQRFLERDEPPNAGESDVAGPWHIEEVPGLGFGLFREGESLARGFHPQAVFPDRWLALIAAAMLPGTGRDPLFCLAKEPDDQGYGVLLDDGSEVGHFVLFDEDLLEGMNNAAALLRSPASLAWLLEAAGPVTLERSGAILEERVAEESSE